MNDEPVNAAVVTDEEQIRKIAAIARRKPAASAARSRRLIANLEGDLAKHGDAELWKKYGDLLLANAAAATRRGGIFEVIDYFDDAQPIIAIESDERMSLAETAEHYFRRYTKARNGKKVIAERINAARREIEKAKAILGLIEAAVAESDIETLERLAGPAPKPQPPVGKKKKAETAFKGARRFLSTDGFEILVGKKAADNDFLTFRIARSLDLWLHAADYPGSHVVVRNNTRAAVPYTTLVEAAQIAAFYSDARSLGKAAVRHTQKKFVNKPKRSLPGLVSLSKFSTILVEPQIPVGLDNRSGEPKKL